MGVLGAYEVDLCSGKMAWCHGKAVRIQGDEHQIAMMGLDAEDGVSLPNISKGAHEALARFFVFGNGLVQLLKFADSTTGESIGLSEPRTSPAWLGQAHIDFWVEEGLDPNEYIRDVEH